MESSNLPSLNGPEEIHVLISHHASQQELVTKLENNLARFGLTCRTSNASASNSEIKRWIWHCRLVLLVLSEEYTTTQSTIYAATKAEHKAKELGDNNRLVCLKCDDHKVPKFLTKYQQVNLTDQDYMNKLLTMMCTDLSCSPGEEVSADTTAKFAAWMYYCGFLQLVLPKLSNDKPSIRNRILNDLPCYEDNPRNMPRRMLILVPSGGFFPPSISEKDPAIVDKKLFLFQSAHRAGHPNRDYKNPVHAITDKNGLEYWCVLEIASPALTMYEMTEHAQCSYKKEDLDTEMCKIYYAMQEIIIALKLGNEAEVIYYKDNGEQLLSEVLLKSIKNLIEKDIDLEMRDQSTNQVEEEPQEVTGRPRTFHPASDAHVSTFIDMCMSTKYQMRRRPRGVALILNMINFETNCELATRVGAQIDQDNIMKWLKKMDFKVCLYEDLTQEAMSNIFSQYGGMDHTEYDCFVCFILTHGSEGEVYGTDGEAMSITSITDMFSSTNCPSLNEKPKVFFIQACQGRPRQRRRRVRDLASNNANLNDLGDSPPQENNGDRGQEEEDEAEFEDEDIDDDFHDDATPDETNRSALVPRGEHFLMSYATLPGRTAWRNTKTGSYYIQHLVSMLRKYGATLDLEVICDQVRDQVKIDLEKNLKTNRKLGESQVPFKISTLTKKLVLNPRN